MKSPAPDGGKVRRRGEQQGFGDHGETLEVIFVLGIRLGVALGKLGDFGQRLGAILPHEQMRAVGKGRKERGILGVDAIAEALQLQVAHDLFLHQAGEVGGSGNAISGPDFLGDRASADQFARFQDERRSVRPGRDKQR